MLFGDCRAGVVGCALAGGTGRRHHLRQSKIENLRVPTLGYEQIRRLDVAMNNSFSMGRIETVGNFDREIKYPLQLNSRAQNHIPESLALQIFHHQKETALVLANLINRANVWMIQCRRSPRLAPEALQRLRIVRQRIRKKLERDETIELDVLGLVDHTHPAAADFAQHAIMRDGLAKNGWRIRHGAHLSRRAPRKLT